MINKKFFIGTPPTQYVTNFTLASPQVTRNGAFRGIAYNSNDGYLYTLNEVGSGRYIEKRNAATGAHISTGSTNVGGYQGLAIDSNNYAWVCDRGTTSYVRKYNLDGVYQNVSFQVETFYIDSIAIDQRYDHIYTNRTNSPSVNKHQTDGTQLSGFSFGNGADIMISLMGSVLFRSGNNSQPTAYNVDLGQQVGSASNLGFAWQFDGGAYNPIDQIVWINTYSNIKKYDAVLG